MTTATHFCVDIWGMSNVAEASVTSPVGTTPVGSRVLSIQSHTVHGYVGNKSAVFPLQLLGFDVDPVNSVQFSNHTGYGSFTGQVLGGEELTSLVQGLENNSLLQGYTHMLTGYIGSETFLRAVLDTVRKIKKHNPDLIYMCDPVLGDNGRLYVPEDLVRVYRDEVVPCATMLTPNQFECELLTGIKISTPADAIRACDCLHAKGVKIVLLTSLEYSGNAHEEGDELVLFVSKLSTFTDASAETRSTQTETYDLHIKKLDGYFTGTGDLIASTFLAWSTRYPENLPLALEMSAATVQGVLQNTMEYARAHPSRAGHKAPPELRLVQSKSCIESPTVVTRANTITRDTA